MSYTYSTWLAAVQSTAVELTNDANFLAIVPSIIDYAEQRCYRELDLLSTVVVDGSAFATPNARKFTLPSSLGRFVRVDYINIITPIGAPSSTGKITSLVPATKEYLDTAWPTNAAASLTTVPKFFAMITDQEIRFGPPPGDAFNVVVGGTIRPNPLSASNSSTILTNYLPDLFFAASMIFVAGWQRNFGAQSDDPRMAQSWETQFQGLLATAKTEEMHKKLIGAMAGKA